LCEHQPFVCGLAFLQATIALFSFVGGFFFVVLRLVGAFGGRKVQDITQRYGLALRVYVCAMFTLTAVNALFIFWLWGSATGLTSSIDKSAKIIDPGVQAVRQYIVQTMTELDVTVQNIRDNRRIMISGIKSSNTVRIKDHIKKTPSFYSRAKKTPIMFFVVSKTCISYFNKLQPLKTKIGLGVCLYSLELCLPQRATSLPAVDEKFSQCIHLSQYRFRNLLSGDFIVTEFDNIHQQDTIVASQTKDLSIAVSVRRFPAALLVYTLWRRCSRVTRVKNGTFGNLFRVTTLRKRVPKRVPTCSGLSPPVDACPKRTYLALRKQLLVRCIVVSVWNFQTAMGNFLGREIGCGCRLVIYVKPSLLYKRYPLITHTLGRKTIPPTSTARMWRSSYPLNTHSFIAPTSPRRKCQKNEPWVKFSGSQIIASLQRMSMRADPVKFLRNLREGRAFTTAGFSATWGTLTGTQLQQLSDSIRQLPDDDTIRLTAPITTVRDAYKYADIWERGARVLSSNSWKAMETRLQDEMHKDYLDKINAKITANIRAINKSSDHIHNALGNCKPLVAAYQNIFKIFCDSTLNNLNGFWFALWIVSFLFSFIIVVALKLSKYFMRMDDYTYGGLELEESV
ncbi:unnamed protein product, partial [Ixodes persulcatus]